uniref:TetR/AcrR family transcriptional regulator n=1 Tax=Thaumasiovibrio occultus TaxID=1891184 RepID=UPI000B36482F|nr:TetR/AcrR family transcriptional regulator [Thaumasiovibrio occultus]
MAKISRAEREANKQRFDALVLNIFLLEGWEAVTLTRLAQETGTRMSTLQGYYPTRRDLGNALTGKVFPHFLSELNFESEKSFRDSWMHALAHNNIFRGVITLLLESCVMTDTPEAAYQGLLRLKQLCQDSFGDEHIINCILGESVVYLASQTPASKS